MRLTNQMTRLCFSMIYMRHTSPLYTLFQGILLSICSSICSRNPPLDRVPWNFEGRGLREMRAEFLGRWGSRRGVIGIVAAALFPQGASRAGIGG